jgi:hypothetical protein
VRLLMFWSSYAPLFLLLAIRFSEAFLRVATAALFVGGVVALTRVLGGRSGRLAPDPYELCEIRDEGAAVAGYLVSYILPIAAVAVPSGTDVAAYALFLAMLAVVHARTPLVQVNPLLYLAGYRVFAVRMTSGFKGYLVCDRDPVVGDRVQAVTLTGTILKATVWLDYGGTGGDG